MATPYEYLLESRCSFEQRNMQLKPISGVYFRSTYVVPGATKNGDKHVMEFYLKDYRLSLQVILPLRYPLLPPSARFISDRDSTLPNHKEVDQAEGYIEREFQPGEWTPAITVRDFISEIIKLLEEANANKNASNMATMDKRVFGFYKDLLRLQTWEYMYLTREKAKFVEYIKQKYSCQIRFRGGQRRVESESVCLTIEADEKGPLYGAKQAILAHLRSAAPAHFDQRSKGAVADEAVDQKLPTKDLCVGGTEVAGLTIGPETKSGAGNERDQVDNSAEENLANENLEEKSNTGKNGNLLNGNVTGLTNGAVGMTAAASMPQAASSRTNTAVEPSAACSQLRGDGQAMCVYCYKQMPSTALNEHQQFCWRSPMTFYATSCDEKKSTGNVRAQTGIVDLLTKARDDMLSQVFSGMNASLESTTAKLGAFEDEYTRYAASYLLSQRALADDGQRQQRVARATARMICSVCLTNEKDRVLRCGHMFCRHCLEDLHREGDDTCPMCRAETGYPRRIERMTK